MTLAGMISKQTYGLIYLHQLEEGRYSILPGYVDRIARMHLTGEKVKVEELKEGAASKYLGGKVLGGLFALLQPQSSYSSS